ncbi:signal peptide peptidase SppA [Helicobacter cappadocius]|uniref:Signal peptide peptidase SppA n=1 Tax=Helicobacter cappadocius TaxID=3063998 RepID=A0AA90Q3C4_9HELI|nr:MULTISPECIES: signal peptide peptidase SppA [unclassified Helicobacter]MDO7253471.1 signal peptide peptidase SppA [Helicobacter sp. faydin-H75]MDP2539398.1 signal peptide peptidase SppA [Helicobacter sp. faydin-H76]
MIKKIFNLIVVPLDFITKYFKAMVFLLIVVILIISVIPNSSSINSPNLAKIYLQGPIIDSEGIRTQIDKILATPSIKGVLLIINSPGGAVSASVEISDMIADLKQKMPVIAYVQGAMASGSYYAGMYADKIYANRGALIGSIGVIFDGANISELANKLGIQEQVIAAGEYKEIGTFMRKWTPQEKDFLQKLINEEYEMFLSDVADARGLDIKSSKEYAEGKVFSAKKALKLGLIDTIGTQNQAIEMLKTLSEVQHPIWLKRDKFDAYLDKIIKTSTRVMLNAFTYTLR